MFGNVAFQNEKNALWNLPLFDEGTSKRDTMQGQLLTYLANRRFAAEDFGFDQSRHHLFSFIVDLGCNFGQFSPGNNSQQSFLKSEGQKFLLPLIGMAKTAPLWEKHNFLLILAVWVAFVESYLSTQNDVQALGFLLALVNECFFFELGDEHAAAEMVNDGRVS